MEVKILIEFKIKCIKQGSQYQPQVYTLIFQPVLQVQFQTLHLGKGRHFSLTIIVNQRFINNGLLKIYLTASH